MFAEIGHDSSDVGKIKASSDPGEDVHLYVCLATYGVMMVIVLGRQLLELGQEAGPVVRTPCQLPTV